MPRPKAPSRTARDIAYRFLARRARSGHEIEKKLREKEVDNQTIAETISFLEKSGLLDDEAFAAEWVECRSKNKMLGPHRLLRELEEKGIPLEVRSRAVKECFQNIDEKELAERAAKKKINSSSDARDEKLKARVYLYLKRRGFSNDAVYSAVNKFFI